MHGAPASMGMLAAYLHEKERKEAHEAFMAQMLWYLNRIEHERVGKKFDHPTWLDLVKPKKKDERSGMEIVEDLKTQLIDRRKKRKRKGGK